MDKKRILLVSAAFYPENSPRSFRATELAKEFSAKGHEVVVITRDRKEVDYNVYASQNSFTVKTFGKENFKEVNYDYKNKFINIFFRGLRRLMMLLFEYPDIEFMFKAKNALMKEKNYDLLISFAVPHPVHWGTAWAMSLKNDITKTWVADCGDPYMGAKTDTFQKLFYFKYIEKWFCRKANYVAITKIEMIGNYYPEFHSKIVEIPQGFNFNAIKIDKEAYVKNQIPTFAFAGQVFPVIRDPAPLLSFLLKQNKDFKLVFYTATTALIEPFLEEAKGKIEIRKTIPREQLLIELAQYDFLLNIAYDPKTQSPSKLIDYIIAGRPILNIRTDILNEADIISFLNGDYSSKFVESNIEKYKIENVANQFVSLVK